MEGKVPESAPKSRIDDGSNVVLGRSAIVKLMIHGVLTDPAPDPLGFHTFVFLHPSLHLPYPSLEFAQIPARYDTEAFLLYLGFNNDQSKTIFEKCKSEAKEPSDINGATMMKYANEHLLKFYRNSMWDTGLDGSLLSEVRWLKSRDDPKVMEGYLRDKIGPVKKNSPPLRMVDHIKECIRQRNANLQQFEAIVHANADW